MHRLTRVLALTGLLVFLAALTAATPAIIEDQVNTTCNGTATVPIQGGGPVVLNCEGDCPPGVLCAPFTWVDGNTTSSQCTCGDLVPTGDTECFFTIHVTLKADGRSSVTATCVNFNCTDTCSDQALGPWPAGPLTFSCVCN